MTLFFSICIWVDTLDSRDVKWAWKVIQYRIQHQLNTLVLEGRTTQYWEEFNIDCCTTDTRFQFFVCDFFTLKVFHHEFFISFRNSFHQFFTIFLSHIQEISWNVFFKNVCTKVVGVDFSFHLDQVNDSAEFIFCTDWQLDWVCICLKTVMKSAYRIQEICTDFIHLVSEYDTWNTVFSCLTPNGFCLRFNT